MEQNMFCSDGSDMKPNPSVKLKGNTKFDQNLSFEKGLDCFGVQTLRSFSHFFEKLTVDKSESKSIAGATPTANHALWN